jgi:hypothetical protein
VPATGAAVGPRLRPAAAGVRRADRRGCKRTPRLLRFHNELPKATSRGHRKIVAVAPGSGVRGTTGGGE